MKLVLGTMTFGESVFAPNVSEFVKMFRCGIRRTRHRIRLQRGKL